VPEADAALDAFAKLIEQREKGFSAA